jgi:hypothetical protein
VGTVDEFGYCTVPVVLQGTVGTVGAVDAPWVLQGTVGTVGTARGKSGSCVLRQYPWVLQGTVGTVHDKTNKRGEPSCTGRLQKYNAGICQCGWGTIHDTCRCIHLQQKGGGGDMKGTCEGIGRGM